MSLTYAGHHRAHMSEVRVRNRADRLRHHDVPALVAVSAWVAALVDWARIPWRNLRLRVTDAWARWIVPASVPGIPVCQTCQQGEHRGCGWFLGEPACGCHCPAAQRHRIELATIEGWGY